MKLRDITYSLLLPALAAGCSSDNVPEPNPAAQPSTVSFSLTTRANMGDNEGVAEDATPKELINFYKVIMVEADTRKVAAIVEKKIDPAYENFFNVTVGAGTYDIYAIANISDEELTARLPYDDAAREFFTITAKSSGDSSEATYTAPSDAAIKSALWSFTTASAETSASDGGTDSDGIPATGQVFKEEVMNKTLVPMTGFLNNVALSGKDDSFEIEVVRLFAKIEFRMGLAPGTVTPATVKKIELLDAMTGPVLLMPDYSNLGLSPEDHLDKLSTALHGKGKDALAGRKDMVFNLNEELPLPAASAMATEHLTVALAYIREMTAPMNAANAFMLRVTMKRGASATATEAGDPGQVDGTELESTVGGEEIVQYALADELLWVNRNDHVIIPITITDWVFDVDVKFYPPIGGYPAVLSERIDDNHVSATFGTQGYFVIIPEMRRVGDNRLLSPEEGAYTIESVETDNPELFITEPAVDPLTGEIVGELSSVTGTARVTLRVSVKNADGEPAATYTKYIYIIREN